MTPALALSLIAIGITGAGILVQLGRVLSKLDLIDEAQKEIRKELRETRDSLVHRTRVDTLIWVVGGIISTCGLGAIVTGIALWSTVQTQTARLDALTGAGVYTAVTPGAAEALPFVPSHVGITGQVDVASVGYVEAIDPVIEVLR